MIFFTSILSNYLSRALLWSESVCKHHPTSKSIIYIYDLDDLTCLQICSLLNLLPLNCKHNVLFRSSRECLPSPNYFDSRYNVVEACTAVKPFIARSLLQEYELVTYLDPDTFVFSPLYTSTDQDCFDFDFQLTPHCLFPNKNQVLSERLFAKYGIFNLGFFSCTPSDDSLRFLDWWCKFVSSYGNNNPYSGLFVDQKPLDFAPVFLSKLSIIRDPGWNMAWWNILIDGRELSSNHKVRHQNKSYNLCFYHFSNLDANLLHTFLSSGCRSLLNKSNKQLLLSYHPDLSHLYNDYLHRLHLIQVEVNAIPLTSENSKNILTQKTNSRYLSNLVNSEIFRLCFIIFPPCLASIVVRKFEKQTLFFRLLSLIFLINKSNLSLIKHIQYSIRAFISILMSPSLNDFSSISSSNSTNNTNLS